MDQHDYYLASTVSVPADSTLIVLGKDAPIYLEENHTIRGGASAAGDLEMYYFIRRTRRRLIGGSKNGKMVRWSIWKH